MDALVFLFNIICIQKRPPPPKKTTRYQPMTKEYTALVVDTNIAYDTYMEKFNIFSSKWIDNEVTFKKHGL